MSALAILVKDSNVRSSFSFHWFAPPENPKPINRSQASGRRPANMMIGFFPIFTKATAL